MVFENPAYLFLLWTLIPVVLLLVYARRKNLEAVGKFVGPTMFATLMPVQSFRRWLLRSFLLVLSLGLLIFACSRPRFGVYFEDTKRVGADIFVLLDVSRSMLAEDVPPNRLDRAKSDIRDLLNRIVGDRIGLIGFAGRPILLVPLTVDKGFYEEVLEKVSVDSAPRGGTEIADAIRLAIRTFPKNSTRDCAIVLITDGEDHGSFLDEAVREAAALNIRIFTIAMGDSREGARIPVLDEHGNHAFLTYEGREVWSKTDTESLKRIAETTQGAFLPFHSSAFDLGEVYDQYLSLLRHGEYHVEKRKQHRERFQMFLFGAILFLGAFLLIPRVRPNPD